MISQKTRSSLKITIGTILVAIGTIVIVAFSSGYNIDVFRGEIFSTGLVLLGSNPSGATIKINGRTISQKTPHRLENFKTGDLTVEYSRNDYKNWLSKYTVRPGQVTFADYALLIPNAIEQNDKFTEIKFDTLFTSTERNKVFGFLNSPGTIYELDKSNSPRKIIELPVNPAIQAPVKLTEGQLSRDGSSLYVKANYPEGQPSFFWVDNNNGQFFNIEPSLGQKPTDIKFNQRNSKELYNLEGGKIRRLNVDNNQILDLNISGVASYQIDKDYLYTLENLSPLEQGQFLVRYDYNGNNRYVLAQLQPTSSTRSITATEYNGQKILAIRDTGNGDLIVFRQAEGKNLTSSIGNETNNINFSPTGRFLSFTQKDTLKTIDIETGDRYSAGLAAVSSLKWLSNYQIVLSKADGLYIIDFNGYNLVKIPPNSSPLDNYTFTTQIDSKSIYYSLSGSLSYYTLQPRGLINFR